MANWSHLPGCICVNCEDTRKFNDLAAKKERTDTDRIEWLDKTELDGEYIAAVCYLQRVGDKFYDHVRLAIDAAMDAEGK